MYVSASDNLGTHLLGRVPSAPDARDFSLEVLYSDDPLDQALAALYKSRAAKATKVWASFVTPYLKSITPVAPPVPPNPTPTPSPAGAVVWTDPENVLDQGQTPHCIGFGGAQWGNTLPVDDKYVNSDGDAIYYECKKIDGEPGQEDGSDVRSLAKALQNRGRLSTYVFASTVDAIKKFVLTQGPVIVGTDWCNDQFNPDTNGYVTPTGGVAGGHCYLMIGYDPSADAFEFLNSWGSLWALNGRFYMKVADFQTLLTGIDSPGEALAAVEL